MAPPWAHIDKHAYYSFIDPEGCWVGLVNCGPWMDIMLYNGLIVYSHFSHSPVVITIPVPVLTISYSKVQNDILSFHGFIPFLSLSTSKRCKYRHNTYFTPTLHLFRCKIHFYTYFTPIFLSVYARSPIPMSSHGKNGKRAFWFPMRTSSRDTPMRHRRRPTVSAARTETPRPPRRHQIKSTQHRNKPGLDRSETKITAACRVRVATEVEWLCGRARPGWTINWTECVVEPFITTKRRRVRPYP